jgi:hypothetical protein
METEQKYRVAPPGFTSEQWETFNEDGIIFIEDAISDEDIQTYIDAIDRAAATNPKYTPGGYLGMQNIVERDPVFTGLIDHERHVGFAYDLFGELLKLHISQFFLRPPGGKQYNQWHPDGARALPYGVFSPKLPLQIKVGYWLTDLPRPNMGNLVVLPGSHRHQYMDGYDTHKSLPGEKIVCPRKGTMTVMHSSIWHRVEPNESDVVRYNIFVAYCPSWITSADRFHSSPEWLKTLNREQRIIMRSYSHAYHNAKPPASEFPLFLDRETGADVDSGAYLDHVQLHRRKRQTMPERLASLQ